MRILIVVAALFLAIGLAGCATLSKQQCQTGDWQSIGLVDGQHGYAASRYSEHVEACAEHGLGANRSLYNAGREQGLRSFCTLSKAAEIGLENRTNYNVCRGELGLSFNRVYREANDVYAAEKEIEFAHTRIESLTHRLSQPKLADIIRADTLSDLLYEQSRLVALEKTRRTQERELREVQAEESRRLAAHGIGGFGIGRVGFVG